MNIAVSGSQLERSKGIFVDVGDLTVGKSRLIDLERIDFFNRAEKAPDGFIYHETFISEAEEQEVIREIQTCTLRRSNTINLWRSDEPLGSAIHARISFTIPDSGWKDHRPYYSTQVGTTVRDRRAGDRKAAPPPKGVSRKL